MRSKQLPVAALLAGMAIMAPITPPVAAQVATPTMTITCEDIAAEQSTGTPGAKTEDMAGMHAGTPMPEMEHLTMELDQTYIDMMIPHHASIIAMAQAALPRLSDERLREVARAIVATQQPEMEELRGFREAFYGEAEPVPMDEGMMTAMDEMMPGMADRMNTKEMAFQMDAAAQVAAICAAKDADLAFIELTIPHHQMAIEASQTVLDQSDRVELRNFAQRVIDAQQQEIDTLTEIEHELTGAATPAR